MKNKLIFFILFCIPFVAEADCVCPDSFCSRAGDKPKMIVKNEKSDLSLMMCGYVDKVLDERELESSCFIVANCSDGHILSAYGELDTYIVKGSDDGLVVWEIQDFWINGNPEWRNVKFMKYTYKISGGELQYSEEYVFRSPRLNEESVKKILAEVRKTKASPDRRGNPRLVFRVLAAALSGNKEAQIIFDEIEKYWYWDTGSSELLHQAKELYRRHILYNKKPNNKINKDANFNALH